MFLYSNQCKTRLQPSTVILSPSTTQVYTGKILNLVCITTNQDMYGPPKEAKWAINGSEIDFKVHRGGISIKSIKRTLSTTTRLTILKVQHTDAGSYECRVNWDKNRIDNIAKVPVY